MFEPKHNQDSLLTRSADWLNMHCLIIMDSTQDAIDWLDSTINVPENTVDSIFALINLGYIYTHFPDTTLKCSMVTMHPEHIPQSYNHYVERREELIQELLKSSKPKKDLYSIDIEKKAIIQRINPNPTNGTFDVRIETIIDGHLKVEIYTALGTKIQELNLGEIQKGVINRKIYLNSKSPGMYYLVVKHNNVVQDTKKIIKM